MSDTPFFDPLPEPEEEGDSQRSEFDLPWVPPVHVAGVVVPVAADVHHGDDVVVRVTHVVAYERGLEVHVSTWLRPGARRAGGSPEAPWGVEQEPRVGLRLADGTRLGHRHPYAAADDVDLTTASFAQTSGNGGGLHSTSAWWVHPVPTGDFLEVVVAWEPQGVPESSARVELAPLRHAAAREEVLWDPPPPPGEGYFGWSGPFPTGAYGSSLTMTFDEPEPGPDPGAS